MNDQRCGHGRGGGGVRMFFAHPQADATLRVCGRPHMDVFFF